MFASLIMYLPKMEKEVGYDDIIVKKLIAVAYDHNIRLSDLHVWGNKVSEEWQLQNVLNRAPSQDEIHRANVAIDLLVKDNILLKNHGEALEEKFDTMNSTLENILDVVMSLKRCESGTCSHCLLLFI